MGMPMIIVEFGEQRQRIRWTKTYLTLNDLLHLFSQTFRKSFNIDEHQILFFNTPIDHRIQLNANQLKNYPRFQIRSIDRTQPRLDSPMEINEIITLKHRLHRAAVEISKVALLLHSICTNYQELIKTLRDRDIPRRELLSHNHSHSMSDLLVPPGFRALPPHVTLRNSQSTDEGIDRDTENDSVFDSTHGENGDGSVFEEYEEDLTITNAPIPAIRHHRTLDSLPFSRNQNFNHATNVSKKFRPTKTRVIKAVNSKKPPLPPEKKKNIPCKYAAGGNCKRGNQCRFIHAV